MRLLEFKWKILLVHEKLDYTQHIQDLQLLDQQRAITINVKQGELFSPV